tara:strand:- start:357 stop:1133 length:777 start_codon:yes stop_codon:yes gene_type:complete
MSLTGRSVSAFYKDLLEIDNSNSGVDSTLRAIKSGDGTSASLQISKSDVKVLPSRDSTTTLDVQDADGNTKLLVDTTNDYVKALGHHANTQYVYFGALNDTVFSGALANTHYMIPFQRAGMTALAPIGTSTNPDTSTTISSTADDVVACMWYIMDNITIDRVVWWHGGDAAGSDTTRAHLMQYDVVNDNSSTSGDLSSGVVLADGSDITNAGYEQAYYQQLTIQSANVDAGKAVFFVFRSDSVNSDFTINATIKFHLR